MKRKISILFFDLLLLIVVYLFTIWAKPASVAHYLPQYTLPFIGFLFLWGFTSFFTDKYVIYKGKKINEQIIAITISNFAAIGLGMFIIYVFRVNVTSRFIVVGTFIITYVLEIIIAIILIINAREWKAEEEEEEEPKRLVPPFFPDDQFELAERDQPYLPFTDEKQVYAKLPFLQRLKDFYLSSYPELYSVLSKHIKLEESTINNTLILNTHTIFNIENYVPESQFLFINLHKVNDIRRINRFFIQVNQNLMNCGYYVSCCQTKALRKESIYRIFPPILNGIIYMSDVFLHRILPKLPFTKQLYFFFTRGKNRSLSRAETFGRLYACGFEVIAEEVIDKKLFFIARKLKAPIFGNEPTYGLLVKLPRIGKEGKVIKVFKFRTMHPFSEYLQAYVYKHNNLDKGGKFKNDFRITSWGRFMRRMWIDELPMIINILKGDMKLVGVRPISKQFMSLYSTEHQELRKKVKPGLLPPFYADMPETIAEIEYSEALYIRKSLRHPLYTDFIYFFKIFFNIVFKKARSK